MVRRAQKGLLKGEMVTEEQVAIGSGDVESRGTQAQRSLCG